MLSNNETGQLNRMLTPLLWAHDKLTTGECFSFSFSDCDKIIWKKATLRKRVCFHWQCKVQSIVVVVGKRGIKMGAWSKLVTLHPGWEDPEGWMQAAAQFPFLQFRIPSRKWAPSCWLGIGGNPWIQSKQHAPPTCPFSGWVDSVKLLGGWGGGD